MFILATRFHLLLLAVIIAITGVALYRIAPDFVFPAHWDMHSRPDWLWPRNVALVVAPVVAVLLIAAFEILARSMGKARLTLCQHILDPALTLPLLVTAAIQLGLLLIGIGSDLDLIRITVFGLGVMLIVLGIVLAEAERHTYAGLRMPWPIAGDRAWKLVHRIAGVAFGVGGIGLIALAWFTADIGPLIAALPPAMLVPPALAGIATIAADRT
jgi:uncharacterized membrane protein